MPRLKCLIGMKYGRLQILSRAENKGKRRTAWNAICDCGNKTIVATDDLKSLDSRSCGCLKSEKLIAFNKRERPEKPKKEKHIKTDEELLQEAFVRFFCKVEKTDTCWIWKGALIKGYGIMFFKKSIKAHRFSYMIHKGELEKGKFICHTCDNPLCVNPEHLYQGTALQNKRDAIERNRTKVGEDHHKSKLTEEQVKEILKYNDTGRNLAKLYGVHTETIYRVRRNESWYSVSR
jgi:Pectobacterium phage endonuclease